MSSITSANASVILTVEDLYPNGVQIEKFSTDSSFSVEDLTIAESRMGVDGKIAVGYTPQPVNVTLSVEADSPSLAYLCNIYEKSQLNMATYTCSMQITIPAIGKEYTLTGGAMLSGHPFPDGKKVLDPTSWKFTFEKLKSASI